MDWEAFFTVHRDLPREGPGTSADVDWAVDLAGLSSGAVICDAGAGPGGDTAPLAEHVPDGRVVSVELHKSFVEQARARFAGDPRIRLVQGDMGKIGELAEAPFDLIWCAGALYFLGLDDGLSLFRQALRPAGVLAFSEPCFFGENPSDRAREFWEGYSTRHEVEILESVGAKGFEILGHRKVGDAGWDAYYAPMLERIEALRHGAGDRLSRMLDLCETEARNWRAVREQTGYLLVVARRREG